MSLLNQKIQRDVAVLDFSKALHTIPHNTLLVLGKQKYCSINGKIWEWITIFLKQWQQSMAVEGAASEDGYVAPGMPQGMVMGPLLFLLYINDLPRNITSRVRLFADDYLVYRPIKIQDDATVLDRLYSWATTWGMTFNSKCYVMSIDPKKTSTPYFYSMVGQVLAKVIHITYLGIILSSL